MSMVRKQLYITPEQGQRLRTLAARWRCTEAEVVRTALDQLADPGNLDSLIDQRLAAAGLLVAAPDDDDLPVATEADRWEVAETAWLDAQPPAGLGEAVLAERRGSW